MNINVGSHGINLNKLTHVFIFISGFSSLYFIFILQEKLHTWKMATLAFSYIVQDLLTGLRDSNIIPSQVIIDTSIFFFYYYKKNPVDTLLFLLYVPIKVHH